MRWKDIKKEKNELQIKIDALNAEWMVIKSQCKHPNLPVRKLVCEVYMDTCQDCGHLSYCY